MIIVTLTGILTVVTVVAFGHAFAAQETNSLDGLVIGAEMLAAVLLMLASGLGGILVYLVRTLEKIRARGHDIRQIAVNATHELEMHKMRVADRDKVTDMRLRRLDSMLQELLKMQSREGESE